jgi:hypothetical protein
MARVETGFSWQEHGFLFVNRFDFSFELPVPLSEPIDLGSVTLGLCGGMSFGALDYFYQQRAVPQDTIVEDIPAPLKRFLTERQLDAMRVPITFKILEWMLRDNDNVQQLTAQREVAKVYRRIDKGEPAVLVLMRVGRGQDPTQNHQVLVTGYDLDEDSKDLTLFLYDPNHPFHASRNTVQPTLTMNLSRPSDGIDLAQSTGEELRGFFVNSYRRQEPPAPDVFGASLSAEDLPPLTLRF